MDERGINSMPEVSAKAAENTEYPKKNADSADFSMPSLSKENAPDKIKFTANDDLEDDGTIPAASVPKNTKKQDIPPQNVNLGRGSFNLAYSKTKAKIFVAAMAVVVIAAAAVTYFSFRELGKASLAFPSVGIAVFVVGLLYNVLISGQICRYEANGREFSVSRSNQPTVFIFYKDVMSVEYEELKLFNLFYQGFTVRIHTMGEVYTFEFCSPGRGRDKKNFSFENTPFYIITKQIDTLGLMNMSVRDDIIGEVSEDSDILADRESRAVKEQLVPGYESALEEAFAMMVGSETRKLKQEENEKKKRWDFSDFM